MKSRKRILNVLQGESTDHTPLCFLLNSVMQESSRTQREFLERQISLGIDAVTMLPDPVWGPHPSVTSAVRREHRSGRHDLLHKIYHTPAGDLTTTIELSDDRPHGDEVPLMTDFVIPRARNFLVSGPQDMEPLKHLLQGPTGEAIDRWRERALRTRMLADEFGVATRGALTASAT